MAKKLRIEYSPDKCIGNGSCKITSPENFQVIGNKAILLRSSKEDGKYVLEGEFENYENVINAAKGCPANAIKVTDIENEEEIVSTKVDEDSAEEIIADYDDRKEFVLDPIGYFLIRIIPDKKDIEVGFCNSKNKVVLKVAGKKPIDIYHTIINKVNLDMRKDHCAYLGRELQKAYIALQLGIEYVQDDELNIE